MIEPEKKAYLNRGWGHFGYDQTDAQLDLIAAELQHEHRMEEIRELDIKGWVNEFVADKTKPKRHQGIIARLRARSKSGTQSGAEKPRTFDRASDTALGANAPIRVIIKGQKADLRMTVRNRRDRRFVLRFLREIATE